jgi:CrcB protein
LGKALGLLGGWLYLVARHRMVWLLVGGAVGTYARYWLGRWFNTQPWAQGFPYGTLVINVSGSFILGAAAVIILERMRPEFQDWYLLIGTGFCGGYTTFSTFEWETFKLVRDGSWWLALLNVLVSVVAGFVGVVLGVALVGAVLPRR